MAYNTNRDIQFAVVKVDDFNFMKFILPILLAFIAAAGNALFAYTQKRSNDGSNGFFYIAACALVASLLALIAAAATGKVNPDSIHHNLIYIANGGIGLFFTYFGLNLLYTKFGVSHYVLYAVISIITTTVVVGYLVFKEPTNIYQKAAVGAAVTTVILYSLGQNR